MNPSTALAVVLVDELVRGGVREAVLSPGSRSAPLALALHAADAAGRLRLHVRIDERSAGFLALGLAKGSGQPVPVVTTSGTATANLHPAVLEASYSDVPVVVLTADRPPELRGTGANQTVDQLGLYGRAVRLFAEVGVPAGRVGDNAYWRALVCQALSAALGDGRSVPGPIHLNLGFREPLTPDGDAAWVESLQGREDGGPWSRRVTAAGTPAVPDDLPPRTLVVLGDGPAAPARAALELAEQRGFPLVAEPSAGARGGPCAVDAAELVVGSDSFLASHLPQRVLVVGRPTLSRAIGRLIARCPSDVVAAHGGWPDASRTATRVLPWVPAADAAAVRDPAWLADWREAGAAARAAVDRVLGDGLSEPAVAGVLADVAPELLFVGSSKPARDLLLAGPPPQTRVLANRGAAGIDGLVSTAVGIALAHQAGGGGAAVALLGDLSLLHDANGLVLGPDEPRPDLSVVVVNNDGGAIFGLLEQAGPEHAAAFERVFGTPHGVDLAALCTATGTEHRLVENRAALWEALACPAGVRVLEVRTNRQEAATLDRAVRAAVGQVLESFARP